MNRVISWGQFENEFRPKRNHLVADAPWDGSMFESFGQELEFVSIQPAANIWTWVDADDGLFYICSGYHFVNRLGYFVSQALVPEGECILVVDD